MDPTANNLVVLVLLILRNQLRTPEANCEQRVCYTPAGLQLSD
uniref:Uncharacterized protein n=1 Tax=Klebsiella pneumoniae TaxID=573 RepID=A0A6M5ZZ25_KLEPN|nr:hypothetical protein [Klebsiella pneumoniae]